MSSPRSVRVPLLLLLACGGSFLAVLDVTITNLAVPDLARDFGVGMTSLSWVVTLYTILFAALLAPAGQLADVVGRVRLFVVGVTAFTAASLLAAAAPTFEVLLVARVLQGIGAALLLPASLAFVLADIPPAARAGAIGLWSASASLAAAAGPALGGVLVDAFNWRALFCINVPVGGWLAWRAGRLPATARTGGRLPDGLGAALLAGGIGLLVLGVTEADSWGWSDPATVGCLLGAAVVGAAALVRATRAASPAIEIGLWKSRTYAVANVVSLLFGVGLYASLLLGVLFLVEVWGYSVLAAGLAMTPGAVASATVGVLVGRTGRRISPRALVVTGALVIAATSAALALWLPVQPHFLTAWLTGGIGLGVGIGAVAVGGSSAAALSVAPQRFAAATGLNIAARQVGGALGIAILAAMLNGRTAADGAGPFLLVYWMIAIVCVGAAVAGLGLALPAPAPVPPPPPPRTGAPAAVPSQAGATAATSAAAKGR
jgi:EmrB/QacA subfamily drug resistance transporter